MAEALYRKYRPQIFEDVIGQEPIQRTLKNAIAQDKVSHAYLFTGPRGTGKTTTARLLAKALLCESGPTDQPDGTCEDCRLIAAGEHPDVYELDAASRTGVENVREEIIGRVQFAPTRGRYKVYIIDEVHMLSTAAFNALLKTLEEPPAHVVFILATTDPQKVPETIHSRCQRFDFRRISPEVMVSRLGAICEAEGVEFEGAALDLIAHRADGGMRNALTSLEQIIAFGEGSVTTEVAERMLGMVDSTDLAEIVQAIGTRDAAAGFRWTAEYVETGADLASFVSDLAVHLRSMYVMAVAGADVPLDISETARKELSREMTMFGPDRIGRLLGILGDLMQELKTSTNPRLSFEIALTRMVRPDTELTLEALAERVEALESRLNAGPSAAAAPVAAVSTPAVPAAPAPAPAVATPAPAAAAPMTAAAPTTAVAAASAAAPAVAAPTAPEASAAARADVVSEESAPTPAPVSEAVPSPVNVDVTTGASSGSAAGAVSAAPAPAASPALSNAESALSAAPGAIPDSLRATLGNPAALQRFWQGVIGTLKKVKTAYGVLFLNTKAVFDEGAGRLIVEFPADNDFVFNAVQKSDVQDELAAALRKAANAELPFSLQRGSGAPVPSPVGTNRPAPVAAPAPAGPAPVSASQSVPSASGGMPAPASPRNAQAPVQASAPAQVPVPAAAPAQAPVPAAPAQAPTSVSDPAPSAPAVVPAPATSAPGAASASELSAPLPDDMPPYDDYVPYDDEDLPWNDPPSYTSAPPAAPAVSVAQAESSAPAVPATPSAPAVPAAQPMSSQAASSPTSGTAATGSMANDASAKPDDGEGDMSEEDLAAALAFGFGEGVSFREIP